MSTSEKQINLVVRGGLSSGSCNAKFSLGDLMECEARAGYHIDLAADRSGDGKETPLQCTSDDVVALTLEDGLQIYTSVGRLTEELVPAEQSRGAKEGEFVIPRSLKIPGQRNRDASDLAVKAFEVLDLKGKAIEKLTEHAGKFAAKTVANMIEDSIVSDGGLYTIEDIQAHHKAAQNKAESLPKIAPVEAGDIDHRGPLLVFVHGTASSTAGSFSDLWSPKGAQDWETLRKNYSDNIFAFEHKTLTQSPIRNALQLAEALPKGATLHLVSHSRGGLVGELLCRGQFSSGRDPFTQEDLDLFREEDSQGSVNQYIKNLLKADGFDRSDYENHLSDLMRLGEVLKEKQFKIERFVRVACPARGTTLASGKLDLYLSSILSIIGLVPALKASMTYDVIKSLVLVFAKERTEPAALPGLEAQMPGSPLVTMLNNHEHLLEGSLAVIAGDLEPRAWLKKLSLLLVDRFYESDHDLVVNTPSMDGGGRRLQKVGVMKVQGPGVHHFSYFERKESRGGLIEALITRDKMAVGFHARTQRRVKIARSTPMTHQAGELPVVFLLPGISGSHLKVNDRIWAEPGKLIRGRFSRLIYDGNNEVKTDGWLSLIHI